MAQFHRISQFIFGFHVGLVWASDTLGSEKRYDAPYKFPSNQSVHLGDPGGFYPGPAVGSHMRPGIMEQPIGPPSLRPFLMKGKTVRRGPCPHCTLLHPLCLKVGHVKRFTVWLVWPQVVGFLLWHLPTAVAEESCWETTGERHPNGALRWVFLPKVPVQTLTNQPFSSPCETLGQCIPTTRKQEFDAFQHLATTCLCVGRDCI